jgi:hypothetical protein
VRHTIDSESSLLATPKASEGSGGALGEAEAIRRGNQVGVRDQVIDLVASQGMKVSRADLLPTPAVSHLRNHDEDVDDHLQRRQDYEDGVTTGMPGASLGVAVRLVEAGVDWKGEPVSALFPTPNTMEHREVKTPEQIAALKARSPGGYRNVREVVINELLPTVTTQDAKNNTGASQYERNTKPLNVEAVIVADGISWGKFEPAIRRWENLLDTPAPPPTKPDGKDGAHRLSSEFTEWLMGMPAGWITGVGLSRNDELKACGNGVVPQQAVLALRMLIEGMVLPPAIDEGGGRLVMLPTPTVSDTYTGNLESSQQKPGSMHSVTLPQAVRMIDE